MKIAITGANGFVGSGLIKHFSGLGHEPVALVRPQADTSLIQNATILKVDYNDLSSLETALKDVDILIHNAGSTRARSYAEMYQSNVELTRNILKAIGNTPSIRQFIMISSQAASRPSKGEEPVTEEMPSAPVTWYGKSKQRAEELVRKSCPVSWTIIRPCSIYGEGDKDFLELIKMVRLGLVVRIGSRDKLLNMIHISELSELISRCLAVPEAYGEVFFACDGQRYTQDQVSMTVAKVLGNKPLKLTIPDALARLVFTLGELIGKLKGKPLVINKQKQNEIMADGWLCSGEKAKRLLGFAPIADLEKHLKETIQWYKKHSWL